MYYIIMQLHEDAPFNKDIAYNYIHRGFDLNRSGFTEMRHAGHPSLVALHVTYRPFDRRPVT